MAQAGNGEVENRGWVQEQGPELLSWPHPRRDGKCVPGAAGC